ncbi:hexose kinase [Candidatus Sumerlaeota bacterium]|nr:hexose kinase [Candidatus Sumerlaeota bacterium]
MILTLTPNPCVDKTVWIERLEPGRPVRGERCDCVAGGKGCNVSKAVRQLGGATMCALVVGGHTGRYVAELLEERHKVSVAPLWVEASTRTITTVLECEKHRQTAIFEPGSAVTDEEAECIHDQFLGILDALRENEPHAPLTVTLNGTVPDAKLRNLYARLIPELKRRKVFVLLDSHGPEFAEGLKAAPDAIKPNRQEVEELLGMPLDSEETLKNALTQLHEMGVELAVITDGVNGAAVSRREGGRFQQLRAIPPQVEEINSIGSGDCFVGGLVHALQIGQSLEDAVRLASACGASNASHWDIGALNREEILRLVPQIRIEPL